MWSLIVRIHRESFDGCSKQSVVDTLALKTACFDQCPSKTRVCVFKVVEISTRIILGDKT